LGKDLKATRALAGRTVARVSAAEHMANYQAARALMGKERGKYRTSGVGCPFENRLLKIMEKVFLRS